MEDGGRRLSRLLLITSLVVAGFMAYNYFFGPEPTPPGEEQASGEGYEGGSGEPQQTTPEEQPEPTVDPAVRAAQEELFTIETEEFTATLSNLNSGIKEMLLLKERYEIDGAPKNMVTTNREAYYAYQLDAPGVEIPADAIWRGEQLSPTAVRFVWEGNSYRVSRRIEAGEAPYQLWSTVRIENQGSTQRRHRVRYKTYHYVRREDEDGGFLSFASRSPELSHGICMWGEDEVTRFPHDELEPDDPHASPLGGHGMGENVRFSGIENSFFANVFAVDGEPAERCQISSEARFVQAGDEEPDGSLFKATLIYPRTELEPGEATVLRTLAYIGPKDNDALTAAGHNLKEVVDLGWFSVVAAWLVAFLRVIYGFVGNWGVAIILMTVIVRIALFPLTWKSFQSMGKMRVLKPEMDKINEMYADSREKKGAAMMELYRKHKVNPLGGCLPQLLQMPVWFAFYASLSTNVELYHAEFALWWTDLSAPDPYYSLPLLLGALMHIQQRITPAAMEPAQQKMMMYFMPIMITSFMLFLPAGLCLYMVTNSILGISQQQWIHRSLNKKDAERRAQEAAQEAEEAAQAEASAEEAARDASSVVSRTKPRSNSKRKTAKRRTRRART
ncbi:MAG: membrane protein insertase YidC [Myxococcota bacterium]